MSVRRFILCAAVLWLAFGQATPFAHRLPPEVVAFFKVDGPRLRVVVRVPTAILLDARLPMVQTTFLDVGHLDPTLKTVGAEVVRSLDVTDDGRPLAASAPTWILSPFSDRSFASFDAAVKRLQAEPMPADSVVYWNEAFADYQFEYPLPGGEARVSARLNGLRMGGDFFQTRATYIAADGDTRTVVVTGPPQRIVFEPGSGDALRTVLGRGVERLASERMLWLFLLCLAIPVRRSARVGGAGLTGVTGVTGTPFAVFAVALIAGLAATALRSTPMADQAWDAAQFISGAAVLLAAVQVLLSSGVVATSVAGLVSGASLGVILGARLFALLPLAGSHRWLALIAFAVLAVGAAAVVLALLSSLTQVPYRWQAPAWLITAFLSALPAHEAAHQLVDAAGRLGGVDPWTLPPVLAWFVTYWPGLAVLAFAVTMQLLARSGRLKPLGPLA